MPRFGVAVGLTVTGKVAVLAHCPAVGVNVKVKLPGPAAVGLKVLAETPVPDQFPLMPLTLVGRLTGAPFEQNGPMGLGIGVTAEVTETIIVVGRAHWPAVGVKVAVMVLPPCPAGLMLEGFQVPVMPWLEVVGNTTGAAFSQSGPTWLKVGVGADVPFTTTLSK